MLWRYLLASLFIFYSCTSLATRLSPADRETLQQQQQDILQQNQQQREELERLTPAPALPSPPVENNGGPCFLINRITLNNATLISQKQQQQLTTPYSHHCLNLAKISELTHNVSDWYISRGYITSRAFLTEQDLSHGELTLEILEGRLEKIELDGQTPAMLRTVFPGAEGHILNLRDIEQGMEQINRLRSVPVQIEILPGTTQGLSVVSLTATPEFPLNASLGFDNSGQKSTGTGQLTGSLTGNNLLGLADKWSLNGGRSSDFTTGHDAQSFQAGLSLPYGYALLDYSYSWNNYLSTVSSRGYDWHSRGDTQTHRLTLTDVLYRNSDMKTALSLGMARRNSRNWLNDAPLKSSSRVLSNVMVGINHSQKVAGGSATFNPALTKGVPWLGAENDEGKAPDAPKAEFTKGSLTASFYRPLTRRVTFLTSLYGQATGDRLYGSERLTIGGESSVRGFKEQYLAGDNGGYWRNELNISLFSLPGIGEISAVAAVDGGWLKHDNDDANASGTLWGSAVGLASTGRFLSSQLTLGRPIAWPTELTPDRFCVYYRLGLAL